MSLGALECAYAYFLNAETWFSSSLPLKYLINMVFSALLPFLFFAVSYGVVVFLKGWEIGVYTLISGFAILTMSALFDLSSKSRKILAYLIFFITPLLTATGQIGALTGFGRSEVSLPWQGIAFATSGIAFQIYQGRLRFADLFGSVLQPLRLLSGPLALSFQPLKTLNLSRARIYFGWIVLGAFFYGVLAAGIAPLLILKRSAESVDVLMFAMIFEVYVYLNFCGISLIVLGVLNLIGIRTALNFNAPFSGRNLIGYWQRWHISFGQVLKQLFFHPSRKIFGTSIAVVVVFMASAMWHGMTLNFILWGVVHACGWLITYYLSGFKWIRIKAVLEVLLMFVFIVVGRLIFSEDDAQFLYTKLSSLINFTWNMDAYALNMSLDMQTWLTLAACSAIVVSEIFFPQKMFRYKLLRRNWTLFVLLGLTLGFGSTGLGSAYGTR
jgi:alginate O-acetyltransferase complex protein AlgI